MTTIVAAPPPNVNVPPPPTSPPISAILAPAPPPIALQAVDSGLSWAADSGDSIRALALEISSDMDQLQQLNDTLTHVNGDWQTTAWPTGVDAVVRSLALSNPPPTGLGLDLSSVADSMNVLAQFIVGAPSQRFTEPLPPIELPSITAGMTLPAAKVLYLSVADNKYYVAAADLTTGALVASPVQGVMNFVISSAPDFAKLGALVQNAAEGKTKTAQAKNVYMQELLSTQGRSVDFASNIQQRYEAAMLKIVGNI